MLDRRLQKYVTLQNATVAVALLVVVGWMGSTVSVLQHNYNLQRHIDELDQRVAEMQLRADSEAYQQQYYRSQEFLDVSARDKLGKAAPGEHLILLPPVATSASVRPSAVSPAPKSVATVSNAQKWMQFFFGVKEGR